MERNTTIIESRNNEIILTVVDTNIITHTHVNRNMPNKPKQKQKIESTKTRKAEGKRHILETKGPTQHREIHSEESDNGRSPGAPRGGSTLPEGGAAARGKKES